MHTDLRQAFWFTDGHDAFEGCLPSGLIVYLARFDDSRNISNYLDIVQKGNLGNRGIEDSN